MTYEPLYNQTTSLTNALNQTTMLERSPRSTLVGQIDPLGNRTTATENLRGQIISITDPNGTTFLEYAGSTAVAMTDALGGSSRRVVDGGGRTMLWTDALGRSQGVEYNALNLPTRAGDSERGFAREHRPYDDGARRS